MFEGERTVGSMPKKCIYCLVLSITLCEIVWVVWVGCSKYLKGNKNSFFFVPEGVLFDIKGKKNGDDVGPVPFKTAVDFSPRREFRNKQQTCVFSYAFVQASVRFKPDDVNSVETSMCVLAHDEHMKHAVTGPNVASCQYKQELYTCLEIE